MPTESQMQDKTPVQKESLISDLNDSNGCHEEPSQNRAPLERTCIINQCDIYVN